jgi:RND family efflux transporter MFP subunit
MRKVNYIVMSMLLGAALFSCKPKEHVQPDIVRKVKVAYPTTDSPVSNREFSGTIMEAAEVNLAFRVAGPIRNIYVKQGDFVKQGALIAEIDPRDYEIQTGVYKAQYQQVKAEYDRLTELNNRKSVSDNDYEKAVAGESMLRMKLQNANDQLNDTKLYAPFSGYIQSVKYQKGELVNTGMTVATLLDMKSYLVEVDLPMSFFVRKSDFIKFSCVQSLFPDTAYPLQLIGYQMKGSNNQLYRTTFKLDPKVNPQLVPGMNVQVLIDYQNQIENPLAVPISALVNEEGKTFVWKFDEKTSTVQKQAVETDGLAGEGQIRIISGLKSDELIIVAGVTVLREGEVVKLIEPASATNIGGLM